MCFFSVFFFFKQKTAYEMRISDWSSDVCSSDLMQFGSKGRRCLISKGRVRPRLVVIFGPGRDHCAGMIEVEEQRLIQKRSEEHTSELQSLMRISYAVFCLKKKN